MNRDDIILMAREAGMKACCGRTDKSGKHHPTVNALFSTVPVQWLEQFANLVASEERDACAKACDSMKETAETLMEHPDYSHSAEYERMCAFEAAAERIRSRSATSASSKT